MTEQALASVVVERPGPQNHAAAVAFVERARALLVRNTEEFESAALILKSIKGSASRIEEERKKLKAPIIEAGKAIDRFFGEPIAQLEVAEKEIKRKLVVYDQAQEKLRLEEQRKADEKARKEREALEARAAKAVADGKLERADELTNRAATVVAPVIDRAPPKVQGLNYRNVAKFEIVDAALIPRQYLVVDESKIRGVVKSLQLDTQIPGVRVWMEKEIAAGGA